MKLNFEYSTESEVRRVLYTLSEHDFYIENGYKVILPVGINTAFLDNEKKQELIGSINREFRKDQGKKLKAKLTRDWDSFGSKILKHLDFLPYPIPSELSITLTQYGTGGSYDLPAKITCNFQSTRDLFEISVHELIHCMIEEPVVNHFRLSHWEKESLVEYLIIENLNTIFPKYVYRNGSMPSLELLKKVGWI